MRYCRLLLHDLFNISSRWCPRLIFLNYTLFLLILFGHHWLIPHRWPLLTYFPPIVVRVSIFDSLQLQHRILLMQIDYLTGHITILKETLRVLLAGWWHGRQVSDDHRGWLIVTIHMHLPSLCLGLVGSRNGNVIFVIIIITLFFVARVRAVAGQGPEAVFVWKLHLLAPASQVVFRGKDQQSVLGGLDVLES